MGIDIWAYKYSYEGNDATILTYLPYLCIVHFPYSWDTYYEDKFVYS